MIRFALRAKLIRSTEALTKRNEVTRIDQGIEDLLMQRGDSFLLSRDWDFQYSVQDDIRQRVGR